MNPLLDHLKDALDPPIRDHRVCFVHVPKCGGTTLVHAIQACFSPWRKNRSGQVFNLSEPAARRAQETTGKSFEETRSSLLDYALAIPTTRCVLGHFVVSSSCFEAHAGEWDFVTVLRDPVERLLSHYFYNLNAPGAYAITSDLGEFLQTPEAANLGMQYPIYLGGDVRQGGDARSHLCSDAAIEQTIATLRDFSLVGRLDQLDEFATRFRQQFGGKLKLERRNVGDRQKREDQLEAVEEHLPLIREICGPDLAVYEALFGESGRPTDTRG